MADLLATGWTRPFVQLTGTVRKELLDVLRQPRLIALLVVGPFLVLVLFGLGYDQQATVLTTQFVGPEGAVYEEAVSSYADSLEQYVEPLGYTSDVVGAQRRVASGEIDVVVQFPPDPADRVLDGEQAVINVFHEKVDPIQARSVEIASELAVLELNALVLEEVLGAVAGDSLTPVEDGVGAVGAQVDSIRAAVDAGDLAAARAEADGLAGSLDEVDRISTTSVALAERLGGSLTAEQQSEIDGLTTLTERMRANADRFDEADDISTADTWARRLEQDERELREQSRDVVTLDPSVLTRPFRSDAESLLRETVDVDAFFAPNAIALLLAHLALTIAAMGLVRGEGLGLFELFRVGPMGTREVLAGTYTSYLVVGATIASALVATAVLVLDVPLRGDWTWLVPGLLLLVAASVGLGLVVALVARSDTQAVQFAMLVLLAGLFFGGFFIDLELFRYPVKALSWTLPVTYGIDLLQAVMLRGDDPPVADWVGLVATTFGYGGLAAWLLHRRLQIRAGTSQ